MRKDLRTQQFTLRTTRIVWCDRRSGGWYETRQDKRSGRHSRNRVPGLDTVFL